MGRTAGSAEPRAGSDTKDDAKDKAKEVAGKAQEQVGQAKDQARERVREQVDQRSTQAGERVHSAAGEARSVAEQLRQQGKDAPARYARADGDTVEALGYKTDVTGRAKGAVSDKVQSVRSKVSGATPDGKEGARKAAGIAQENPLGLGIGAVAVGFVAGLLLPSTKVEDEKIGPMADQVKEKAKETGQEAVERGKQVAGEAAETAKQAGREQAEGLRDSAQEKANA